MACLEHSRDINLQVGLGTEGANGHLCVQGCTKYSCKRECFIE